MAPTGKFKVACIQSSLQTIDKQGWRKFWLKKIRKYLIRLAFKGSTTSDKLNKKDRKIITVYSPVVVGWL